MMQLMEFIFFIGFVVVFFLILSLRSRVSMLERELGRQPPQKAAPERTAAPPAQMPGQSQPSQIRGPTLFDQFARWAKEDWLLKLGALLVIIAFGWLTTYAFMNNWIGPMGRIALGIVAGILFLLLGFWRIQKYLHQGGVFLVLGSTVILITLFAARTVYGFFTPTTALAVMFLSTAFVGLASVRYNNRALALGSLILASVAPLLTHSPEPNLVGLFTYLLIVILGTIWIAIVIRRHELTLAALIIISLYSIFVLFPIFGQRSLDLPTLLLIAYVFAAAFFITNTAGLLKLTKKEMLPDLLTAAGNGLFLLAWIMVAAPDEWKSLIIVGWMLLFVVGAFSIFTATHKREPLYVYAGVGVALLAGALSAELQGATLTIAYALEAGVVALLAFVLLKELKIALRTCLLFVGPIALSLDNLTTYRWSMGIPYEDFFVLLTLGIVLLGLGTFFWTQARAMKTPDVGLPSGLLASAGSLYLYALLWLSLQATLLDATAVMTALAVYTIIGLITHLTGKANGQQGLKVYGGVMLGCVVARLLLIDVWSMELSGRIITFFLVGALLISTAFVGRKKSAS